MSEELQTNTTPVPEQGESVKSDTQSAGPATQVAVQEKPETVAKVEASKPKQSNSINGRPSDFARQRQETRALRAELAEIKRLLAEKNVPAETKPSFKEYRDEEILKTGLGKTLAQLREEILQNAKGLTAEDVKKIWAEESARREEEALNNELEKRRSKLEEEGLTDKFLEYIEENPWFDSYSDKLKAFDKVYEEIKNQKEEKTPLAPKKSRMGIPGSGSPVNGGNGSMDVAELETQFKQMEREVATKASDPAFQAKYKELSDKIYRAKEQAASR
jgi:hypothetical protein